MIERPFYFIVVLWGERFRNYFLDLCLPTLLSPRNLPCLATRQRSKFLICTRPEDWQAIKTSPIFALVQRFVDPLYLEIPPHRSGVLACMHMGIGHRRACELAHAAKAYGFVLTPDLIFADGAIERLQQLASQGVELALVPALRFAEEPLFDHLKEWGITPDAHGARVTPIAIDNRKLVSAALASMHSETKAYEWKSPHFHATPSAVWWRVPGEDGIVLHSLSWAPLLLDFAAISSHDLSTLDNWTIDGDYIYKNLGHTDRMHLVLDSDEIFMAAWAPSSDRPAALKSRWYLQSNPMGSLIKKQRFNAAFYGGAVDPLKQRIFFATARWHARPLTESWRAIEQDAMQTLLACVESAAPLEQPSRWSAKLQTRSLRLANVVLRPAVRCIVLIRWMWAHRSNGLEQVMQVVQGQPLARQRLNWRMRQGLHFLLGRQFSEPEPR